MKLTDNKTGLWILQYMLSYNLRQHYFWVLNAVTNFEITPPSPKIELKDLLGKTVVGQCSSFFLTLETHCSKKVDKSRFIWNNKERILSRTQNTNQFWNINIIQSTTVPKKKKTVTESTQYKSISRSVYYFSYKSFISMYTFTKIWWQQIHAKEKKKTVCFMQYTKLHWQPG